MNTIKLTPEQYDKLMDYVFDAEFSKWFDSKYGDILNWAENETMKKEVEDETNKRREEFMALLNYWYSPIEERQIFGRVPETVSPSHYKDHIISTVEYNLFKKFEEHKLTKEEIEILKRAVSKKIPKWQLNTEKWSKDLRGHIVYDE